jgi:hypothetical protein
MTAVPFDTLKFATRLESAGFSPQQARATAEAFVEATGQELATKTDLQIMERDLKIWFGKMMAWQLTAIAVLLGVAIAVVKLL